jgi:hypothetical protein
MKTARAGSSLLVVLFSMALITGLVGVVFNVTTTHTRLAQRTVQRSTAVAFGDAVIECLYDQWRQAMITVTNDTDRTNGLTTGALAALLAAPSTTELPAPPGVTLQSWSVTAATPLLNPVSGSTGRPVPENGTNISLRVRLHYLATATVTYPGPTGNNTVTIQRDFVRAGRNLFNNFFFGTQQKTEFHPGPPMYVNGTMYVGGDLFTAHDSLHLLKDVTFTGTHTINFRTEDSRYGTEDPDIDNNGLANNWDINNPPHPGLEQKLFDTAAASLDPNFLDDPTSNDTDSDGNPNNNGYHEIVEEPVAGFSDPLQLDSVTNERFSQNADYRIYVDASNNVTVYKGTSSTALLAANAERVAIVNALTTNTALKDVRDGDNVRVVTMDVAKVKTGVDTGKILDNNGSGDGLLLYVRDTSNGTSVSSKVVNSSTGATTNVTSSRSRGVKLINGAVLPSMGFTMVSPNMVYIQGDYNSGKTSTTQPASNTTSTYTPPVNTPSPVVTGYDRKPSAVVGDAVNILSNNWNDANSLLAQSSRTASNTTINTAIVAGNAPTTTSSYSGGIENFVRFHENWSDKYYTIYGALAQLYASQQATRPWSAADYSPPNRRWYYDTLLQENNPPGFRVARVYERGRWTLR